MGRQYPQLYNDSQFYPVPIPQEQKNCILQGSSQTKQDDTFSVIVYNYFLDGFPKSYSLAPNDTLYELTTQILNDNKQLKREGIKKFIDQVGKQVSDRVSIASAYPSQYKLQMEIIFNEDIKITNNNKQIEFFMLNQSKSSRNDIFNAIKTFHACEKGGKIIIGVNSEGLIKGETIPDQDRFKGEFEAKFRDYLVLTQSSLRILHDIDISFFRVKGQSKLSYKYQDHKKIMIIKIKGTNQHALSQNKHFVLNEKINNHCNQQKKNYSYSSSPSKKSFKLNPQSKPFNSSESIEASPNCDSSESTDTSSNSDSSEESSNCDSSEQIEASSNCSSSEEVDSTLKLFAIQETQQSDNSNNNESFDIKKYIQNVRFCSQFGNSGLQRHKIWESALFLQ